MPLITSDISTVNKQDLSTTITIRYTPTPLTRSLFDTYRSAEGLPHAKCKFDTHSNLYQDIFLPSVWRSLFYLKLKSDKYL